MKWMNRAAEKTRGPGGDTDKTDKSPLLSVMAVPLQLEEDIFVPEIVGEHTPFRFPSQGFYSLLHPISDEAIREVDAIRNQALALGWTNARLYQNRGRIRFPCGPDWGLVCFLEADDQIGKTTSVAIEIIHQKARITTSRFFREPGIWNRERKSNL